MTNVQWKDSVQGQHRFTPIETEAGPPRVAWSTGPGCPRGAPG
jgi:hypothetical protein